MLDSFGIAVVVVAIEFAVAVIVNKVAAALVGVFRLTIRFAGRVRKQSAMRMRHGLTTQSAGSRSRAIQELHPTSMGMTGHMTCGITALAQWAAFRS